MNVIFVFPPKIIVFLDKYKCIANINMSFPHRISLAEYEELTIPKRLRSHSVLVGFVFLDL